MSASAAAMVAPLSNDWPAHCRRSEALGDEITELCGYIAAATQRLLEMIREFDQQELWHLDGICSCAHWLNWKCGIGMNAAREKVRVANALGELPKISASFARGEISYSKVRAMTRVATAENEDYLVDDRPSRHCLSRGNAGAKVSAREAPAGSAGGQQAAR